MVPQHTRTPEQRRFLAITFRVGARASGYLVGPILVSTRDYKQFHFWDEPSTALLTEDDYEVVKAYRLGLTYAEATREFAKDFPPTAGGPYHCAGWFASDGAFYSAEGWPVVNQQVIIAA